jgi:hypothetical protein
VVAVSFECVAGSITRYLGYRKLNLIIALE